MTTSTTQYYIEISDPSRVDILDEMYKACSQQLAKSIDWEILSGLWISMGYYRVILTKNVPSEQELKDCAKDNLTGEYKSFGYDWLFAEEKDMVLFSLRWI